MVLSLLMLATFCSRESEGWVHLSTRPNNEFTQESEEEILGQERLGAGCGDTCPCPPTLVLLTLM